MTRQLFKVGETVILQSVSRPHLNGEYEVSGAYSKKQADNCLTKINGCIASIRGDSMKYILVGLEKIECQQNEGIIQPFFDQSALRKKHQGGDDFETLMSSLNKDKVTES